MLILFGFIEESVHIMNALVLVYLIKGCGFNVDYKKLGCAAVALFVSLFMYETYETTGFTVVLNLFIGLFVFMATVKMNTGYRIIYFILTGSIDTFLSKIIGIATNEISDIDIYFTFADILNSIIIFSILAIFACYKFNKMKTKEREESNAYIHIYLSIGLLLGTFIFIGVDMMKDMINLRLYIALLILAFLTPVTNALMYIFCINKNAESIANEADVKLMERSLQLQSTYFTDMVRSYEDLKHFRHDVKGYFNTINNLLEDRKYSEIHELVENLTEEVRTDSSYKCSNIYIGATVHQFLNVMETKGIEFVFEYNVHEEIYVKIRHLCSLFYNLLSNAIEAASKCDIKMVKLNITTKNNALIINLVNSVDAAFCVNDLRIGLTTKKDNHNHGFGLFNIHHVVDQYNGNIVYNAIELQLQTSIVLLDVTGYHTNQ